MNSWPGFRNRKSSEAGTTFNSGKDKFLIEFKIKFYLGWK